MRVISHEDLAGREHGEGRDGRLSTGAHSRSAREIRTSEPRSCTFPITTMNSVNTVKATSSVWGQTG